MVPSEKSEYDVGKAARQVIENYLVNL